MQSSTPTPAEFGPSLPGLDANFLKRTAVATLLVSLIVAIFGGTYYSMAWAARYILLALWSLTTFGLSAYLFHTMIFNRDRRKGFAVLALKLASISLLFPLFTLWPIPEGAQFKPQAIAVFAGVFTPMLVVVLRALGFLMELQSKRAESSGRSKRADGQAPPNPGAKAL